MNKYLFIYYISREMSDMEEITKEKIDANTSNEKCPYVIIHKKLKQYPQTEENIFKIHR